MRDNRRYIGRWLSALLMVVLLLSCSKSSDGEGGGEESGKKPVLKVYVFAPDRPIVTRADNGEVDATPEENKIHSLHIWVFETTSHDLVGHINMSNVELSESGSEVAIEISDEFIRNKPNVDVYVVANVTSANCGISIGSSITPTDLEAKLIGSGYFGVSSLIKTVPSDGLPMSGVLKNQEVYGESPVLRVGTAEGGLSNVRLVRSVSKVRFVFSKSSENMDDVTINSITLDGSVLPNEEYLFLAGAYPDNRSHVKTDAGYVSETTLVSNVPKDAISTNTSPAAYSYVSTMSGPEYEARINTGITNGDLSEVGRFYFRESDKQLSGKITYTIGTNNSVTKTFQNLAIGDFTRNHTWIVYGYFVTNGDLDLNIVESKIWNEDPSSSDVYNW